MLLSGNLIYKFSNSDLDHDHRRLGTNPKLPPPDISYPDIKFGVNRPKQTKIIEQKLNFYFLATVTFTLITDTWVVIPSCLLKYPFTKIGANRP
jgi:hypothetical protein